MNTSRYNNPQNVNVYSRQSSGNVGDRFGVTPGSKQIGNSVFSTITPDMADTDPQLRKSILLHDEEYSQSIRFRPPHENFDTFWGYGFRFVLAELVATIVFCALCFLVQANINLTYSKFGTPAMTSIPIPINSSYTVYLDTAQSVAFNNNAFYSACVRGLIVFILVYQFWNWGKVLFNPALSFAYWFLGHITFTRLCFAWIAQFVGSLIGYALVYTFTCSGLTVDTCVDPTIGVGLVNVAGHTAGFHAAWEILGSFILTWTAIWMYSSDRLYKEGVSHMIPHESKTSEMNVKYGEAASLNNNMPVTQTLSIPAEYVQRTAPVYSFTIAIVLGAAYTVLTFIGYIVTGGDGSLNFLLWFPRVLNQSGKNSMLGIPLAEQGAIYFFCPFVGAIVAVAAMFLFVVITRRCTFDKKDDRAPVLLYDIYPFTY